MQQAFGGNIREMLLGYQKQSFHLHERAPIQRLGIEVFERFGAICVRNVINIGRSSGDHSS